MGILHRPQDRFDHSFAFLGHGIVPEAQDPKVLRFQEARALIVVGRLRDMLAAVDFDD
jgi:hypothetical protein